jgi:hypothetical protein
MAIEQLQEFGCLVNGAIACHFIFFSAAGCGAIFRQLITFGRTPPDPEQPALLAVDLSCTFG